MDTDAYGCIGFSAGPRRTLERGQLLSAARSRLNLSFYMVCYELLIDCVWFAYCLLVDCHAQDMGQAHAMGDQCTQGPGPKAQGVAGL